MVVLCKRHNYKFKCLKKIRLFLRIFEEILFYLFPFLGGGHGPHAPPGYSTAEESDFDVSFDVRCTRPMQSIFLLQSPAYFKSLAINTIQLILHCNTR